MILWVRNFLADYGVDSYLVGDASGSKSNLFASIGPCEEGGVVLSGHTDVVPIDGQTWSSDPFTMTERDSRLHGRGACDMKEFIAGALAQVPSWNKSKLHRPIHLMLSYDEEIGCLGVRSMIEAASQVIRKPAAVIVGEPTRMRVANEHKGVCTVRTRVSGVEAHSSLTHQGMSAVMLAGELIHYLSQIALELARAAKAAPQSFAPPYTTLGANRIEGGTAMNILAAACEFGWDIRALPGENSESVLKSSTGRGIDVAGRRDETEVLRPWAC